MDDNLRLLEREVSLEDPQAQFKLGKALQRLYPIVYAPTDGVLFADEDDQVNKALAANLP